SAETTGPPLAEVVLNSSFARLAEEAPRFPTGSRQHRDFREFFMGVFRSVAAAQAMHDANDFAAWLQSRCNERSVNQMRNQRVRGDEHVGSRHQNRQQAFAKPAEEIAQRY